MKLNCRNLKNLFVLKQQPPLFISFFSFSFYSLKKLLALQTERQPIRVFNHLYLISSAGKVFLSESGIRSDSFSEIIYHKVLSLFSFLGFFRVISCLIYCFMTRENMKDVIFILNLLFFFEKKNVLFRVSVILMG